MDENGRVRWGIIGCGDVCEKKSGPAFQRADGSALVAVMRRDLGKAKDFAARHGVARAYGDAREIIADPEVDAVYVATPPSSHAEHAIACASAGKPAYVEKPMATSVAACERMIAAFERARVPLFVAYYRRALPRFLAVRDALSEIGDVRVVTAQILRPLADAERSPATRPWRVDPAIAGGGHFVDLACHTLDLLDFLLGPMSDVRGAADNLAGAYEAEDTVSLTARFPNGAHMIGNWCFCADARADEVEIVGDRGAIRFATFAHDPVVIESRAGKRALDIAHPDAIQQPLVQSIVDELRGRGKSPSTGTTAIRTTRVMEAALARRGSR